MPVAKFQINKHISYMGGHVGPDGWESHIQTNVELNVVTGNTKENKLFFDATPTGNIMLGGLSHEIAALFPLGKEVYVEFTVDDK